MYVCVMGGRGGVGAFKGNIKQSCLDYFYTSTSAWILSFITVGDYWMFDELLTISYFAIVINILTALKWISIFAEKTENF